MVNAKPSEPRIRAMAKAKDVPTIPSCCITMFKASALPQARMVSNRAALDVPLGSHTGMYPPQWDVQHWVSSPISLPSSKKIAVLTPGPLACPLSNI